MKMDILSGRFPNFGVATLRPNPLTNLWTGSKRRYYYALKPKESLVMTNSNSSQTPSKEDVTLGILTDYVNHAMARAVFDKLDDGTYCGRIPQCAGVVAFGKTLVACEADLRSTLEDWILVGLKFGHPLPVIDGIDLNKDPKREPVEAR
jgi:predicted RNase H-like HicB family nuclease